MNAGSLTLTVVNAAQEGISRDIISWKLTNPDKPQASPAAIYLSGRWTYGYVYSFWERPYNDVPPVPVDYISGIGDMYVVLPIRFVMYILVLYICIYIYIYIYTRTYTCIYTHTHTHISLCHIPIFKNRCMYAHKPKHAYA
jgi:hypothetical protein